MNPLEEFNALLDTSFDDIAGAGIVKSKFNKLGYVNEPGKIALSFSRGESLYKCPRKFLLREIHQRKSRTATIDTAYGHAFGSGVQEIFRSGSIERAWVAAGAAWDFHEFVDPWGKKKDKSLWMCLVCLEQFYQHIYPEFDQEYQLAYIQGTPGIELFVYVDLGERYSYQVHIDLILQNKVSGALCVAEIKTSGFSQQEANWGNADQTNGYYTILECLSNKLGLPFEPGVIYITSQSGCQFDADKNYGFNIFPYVKTKNTSLDFIRGVILQTQQIDLYIEAEFFPKRGSNCVEYSRPCEFYGTCDLDSAQYIGLQGTGVTYDSLSLEDVDFKITAEELLVMLDKNETNQKQLDNS